MAKSESNESTPAVPVVPTAAAVAPAPAATAAEKAPTAAAVPAKSAGKTEAQLKVEYETLRDKVIAADKDHKRLEVKLQERVKADLKKNVGDVAALKEQKRQAYIAWQTQEKIEKDRAEHEAAMAKTKADSEAAAKADAAANKAQLQSKAMPPLFIAYYTIGTPYADESHALAETLAEFGREYDIRGVPNLRSWEANTSFKPTFVCDMMLEHEGRPLVYVDADARLRQRPVLLDDGMEGIDFAAHWRDGHELLSGTLYFGGGRKSWELVRIWQAACAAQPGVWDQKCLQAVIEAGSVADLAVATLPPTYTLIFDLMKREGPPVIEHMQASRRLRYEVSK